MTPIRNLLRANLRRLRGNRAFWLVMAVMAVLTAYIVVSSYTDMLRYAEYDDSGMIDFDYVVTLDELLFAAASVYGIAAAALVSLFNGEEYSGGTIRNKLAVGGSRVHIYLAGFLTSALAVILMYLLTVAVSLPLGLLLLEDPREPVSAMLLAFGFGLLVSVCYAAIFTFISMLCASRTHAAVLCLLLAIGLLMGAVYVGGKLTEPEYAYAEAMETDAEITAYSNDGTDAISLVQVPNPNYISGTRRTIYEFLYDINPTSQAGQMAGSEIERPVRAAASDVVITMALCFGGVLLFRKKDLK